MRLSIGEFARLGRISVRMLRYYEAMGVLAPHLVDSSGDHQSYSDTQLGRLNRIAALSDLGLSLDQVQRVLLEGVGASEIRAMLRLRRGELETGLRPGTDRAQRIEARLRLLDREQTPSRDVDIIIKSTSWNGGIGTTAITSTGTQQDVGPVLAALFTSIAGRLCAAGIEEPGMPIAFYQPVDQDDDPLRVAAFYPATDIEAATSSDLQASGLDIVEAPAAHVAAVVHRGPMGLVDETYQRLFAWTIANGHVPNGQAREVHVEMGTDETQWVTEIQVDLVPTSKFPTSKRGDAINV